MKAEKLTPVNIIIGPNGSGKAGLLKILYGVAKSLENFQESQRSIAVAYKKVLADKLFNTFQPRKSGLGELVRCLTKR